MHNFKNNNILKRAKNKRHATKSANSGEIGGAGKCAQSISKMDTDEADFRGETLEVYLPTQLL